MKNKKNIAEQVREEIGVHAKEHRGRPQKKITFIQGRPFTAKEVVRSNNIKRPVTLMTVLKHIKSGIKNGSIRKVDKLETGRRGRPSIRYELVSIQTKAATNVK